MARADIRRQMTALMGRWETSGETQATFAQRQGVSLAKFRYWLQRIPPAAIAAVHFTPVQVRDRACGATGTIDVVLPTGERLVIAADASADLVRAVVSALRAPC